MAKKELRKLNRAELLELLIAQTERADRLTEELQEAKEQIRNREDLIRQAGELAAAASRLIEMLDADSVKVSPVLQQKPAAVNTAALLQQKQPVKKAAAPQPAQKPKPAAKPQPQTAAIPAAGSGQTLSQIIREAFEQQDAKPAAVKQSVRKTASQTNRQMPKGKVNETNGLDLSAIMAITAGIGKGKI